MREGMSGTATKEAGNGASAGTNVDTKRIGKLNARLSGGILSLAAFAFQSFALVVYSSHVRIPLLTA